MAKLEYASVRSRLGRRSLPDDPATALKQACQLLKAGKIKEAAQFARLAADFTDDEDRHAKQSPD